MEAKVEIVTASISDTAKSLGVGKTKVYQLIHAGRLDIIKIGRRTLVRAESIRALADGAR